MTSNLTYAFPKKLEVLFVAPPKVSLLLEMLPGEFTMTSPMFALNVECQPMGDGCFHPQLGYIPNEDNKHNSPVKDEAPQDLKVKTINSMDVDMVNCEKGNYFDIFCGKATKEDTKPSDVEIWVDTSSSMRRVDFSTDLNFCARRTFVENFIKSCSSKKVGISIFDTSKKQMGTFDSLCINHGLNDEGRMKQWIQDSKVEHLIIITDVDELSPSLRSFLEENDAVMRGGDYADVTSDKLKQIAHDLGKACK